MLQNIYATFVVSSFESSLAFYDAIFKPLGYQRLHTTDGEVKSAEYGIDPTAKVLEIVEGQNFTLPGLPVMTVTLPCKEKSIVDLVHDTALKMGGIEVAKPSLNANQTYSTSIKDPDGHALVIKFSQS
uniref:hypothetical protein n=1 Tax=Trichocoleus desertorum TaxID=1481672 RepID=UPI0025B4E718|nr:hypothetical protein [Trichocoleus desertorum]